MRINSQQGGQGNLPADTSLSNLDEFQTSSSETSSQEPIEYQEPDEAVFDRLRTFLRGAAFGAAIVLGALFAWKLGEKAVLLRGQKDAGVLTSGPTTRKLKQVQNIIASQYLADVDPQLLETWMFKGIAAGLNDPHAAYYSPEEMKQVNEENEGVFFGLGVVVRMTEDQSLMITQVYEDGPAQAAGIQKGDILLQINETKVQGMRLSEAIALIHSEGQSVDLSLQRDGETYVVHVDFDQVEVTTVTGEMLEPGVGLIRLTEFAKITVEQFEEALTKLTNEGMEYLIVDVRGNPGGLLDAVSLILDDLLDEGLMIYTRQRGDRGFEIYAQDGMLFDGPVAVLVDENSASAAEVFAGVIQDYEKGPIVGKQTYGKGTVQKTYTMRDGSAFKLTAERYYTAKGQDIDGVGVTPDIVTEEDADDIGQALEALKKWNRK